MLRTNAFHTGKQLITIISALQTCYIYVYTYIYIYIYIIGLLALPTLYLAARVRRASPARFRRCVRRGGKLSGLYHSEGGMIRLKTLIDSTDARSGGGSWTRQMHKVGVGTSCFVLMFQWISSGIYPEDFHFSVVFSKGLSLFQWISTGIVQWIVSCVFHLHYTNNANYHTAEVHCPAGNTRPLEPSARHTARSAPSKKPGAKRERGDIYIYIYIYMCIYIYIYIYVYVIRLNKDIYAYNEGAPNRGALTIPFNTA